MQTSSEPLRVVVAVLTYRRPDDLRALLPMLVAQAGGSDELVEIVVVDNDPDGGAAAIVGEYSATGIFYAHESIPGISAARNRALHLASGADVLVFIDDDERPVDEWLERMLTSYRGERPAGVVGPVISRYTEEPDEWISAGRFFERRRMPTGSRLNVAATNNLLLDVRQIGGLEFDQGFGISGGSDTLFTRALVAGGGRLIWCDEAVVFDVVPATRLTRTWVLQRAFRSGNAWSRTSISLTGTAGSRSLIRLGLTGRGAIRLIGGGLLSLFGAGTASDRHHARGLRMMKRGGGMVSGAWGHVYSEYRRSD